MKKNKMLYLLIFQLLLLTVVFIYVYRYTNIFDFSSITKASRSIMNVSFVPAKIDSPHKSTFTVTPVVSIPSETNNKIGYIQLYIKFDPKNIYVKQIERKKIDPNIIVLLPINKLTMNREGVIQFYYGSAALDKTPKDPIQLPTITFVTKKQSESTVSVDTSNSQIVFIDGSEATINQTIALVNTKKTSTITGIPTPSLVQTIVDTVSTDSGSLDSTTNSSISQEESNDTSVTDDMINTDEIIPTIIPISDDVET
jgi:hypothetical protein